LDGQRERYEDSEEKFYEIDQPLSQSLAVLREKNDTCLEISYDMGAGAYANAHVSVPEYRPETGNLLLEYRSRRYSLSKSNKVRIHLDIAHAGPRYAVISLKQSVRELCEDEIEAAILAICEEHNLRILPGYSKFMFMLRTLNNDKYVTTYMKFDLVHSHVLWFLRLSVSHVRDDWMQMYMFEVTQPAEYVNANPGGGAEVWMDFERDREAFLTTNNWWLPVPEDDIWFN
jgi:hypothetical protein